jgi:hypothetical protein
MPTPNQVLLTIEQIEGWETEAAQLARKIADDQTRLNEVRAKLKAAEVFRPKPATLISALLGTLLEMMLIMPCW